MNLQIALLSDKNASKNLGDDVSEMREMIDNYLAFARGEKEEKVKNINIYRLIKTVCEKDIIYGSKTIKNKVIKNLYIDLKPLAMKRALLNIISNAISYSKNIVEIITIKNDNFLNIFIEDDGKGIPKNKREKFLKPFIE